MIVFAIQTPDQNPFIIIMLDIIDVDINAFVDLDVLDENCLVVDNISNSLLHRVIISDYPFE